ncbi:ArsR/SmtB family transcription factor [Rhizobium halophytocola]|uniref:ArsR/SmtB family transcription factor n=1 Tax=Rhizobium halophytocola TaxID=735519 RepID=UPI001AEA5926|nr:metalloregulator ArsR/SmtB family transcription factor [Rhizobium halophytocola]
MQIVDAKIVDQISSTLSALSNSSRWQILTLLREREYAVGEMVSIIGISQSSLSQHLAKLRRGKLVSVRKEAQTSFYACSDLRVNRILDALNEL